MRFNEQMTKSELSAMNDVLVDLKELLIRCACTGKASLFERGGVVFVSCSKGLVVVYWIARGKLEIKSELEKEGVREVVIRVLESLNGIPFPVQIINFILISDRYKKGWIYKSQLYSREYVIYVE